MTSSPKFPDCCCEVAKRWDLERLFNDLTKLKKKIAESEGHKSQGVTKIYKQYLCLLLSSYTYNGIAHHLNRRYQTVKDWFNENLYKDITNLISDIEELADENVNLNTYYRILADAGYQQKQNGIITPPCYVKRHIEDQVCQEMKRDGTLIRIKGLKHIGKTWLLEKIIIPEAKKAEYQTVSLSLNSVNTSQLTDMNLLLQWFCNSVKRELNLTLDVNKEWDSNDAPNSNATNYLEKVLTTLKEKVLLIALDDVDYIFDNLNIANDFCRLLRHWHDEPNRNNRNSYLWKNFRLVILHSREKYALLDINSSPLAGIGHDFNLEEFDRIKVRDFTTQYKVDWSNDDIVKLQELVGGHPDLIDRAFQQSKDNNLKPDMLLKQATTETGIYRDHLHKLLEILNTNEDLKQVFKTVITSSNPIKISNPNHIFQMESMGLIKLQGDLVMPRCSLYKEYFKTCI